VRADSEAGAVEVGDQALFVIHGLEWRGGVGLGMIFEQRARAADGAFDLPEGIAAMKSKFTTETRRHGGIWRLDTY
jgi:hypothetical protein